MQQVNKRNILDPFYLLSTFFFIGNIPFAPGTFGSLAGLILFLFFMIFVDSPAFLLVCVAVLFVTGVYTSGKVAAAEGVKDPRHIIIDEVAGIFAALIFVEDVNPITIAAVFALFRFFDITKVYPISRMEKLPGGWGIMADDMAAGLLSGLLCYAGEYFLRR